MAHNLKRFCSAVVLCAIWTALIPPPATAEFIQTRAGVYQHSNLRHKIIVSDRGVFFAETDPIPVQVFNPIKLLADNTSHAFLHFDRQTNRYNKLSIGAREYGIAGGFNLRLGDLLVKVDGKNPYVSFIAGESGSPGDQLSILGVLGLTVVVNTQGTAVVALLEANNDFNAYKHVIKDYSERGGALSLGDTRVTEDFVGINLEGQLPNNPCTNVSAVIITNKDLIKLKALRYDRQKGLLFLKRLMAGGASRESLNSLLLLRVDEQSMVGLDYVEGKIKIVQQLQGTSSRTICVIEDIPIE